MAKDQTPAAGASPDGETTPPVAPARKASPKKQKRPRNALATVLKNMPQWKALTKELAEIRARLEALAEIQTRLDNLERKTDAEPPTQVVTAPAPSPIEPVAAEGPPRISNLKHAQMREEQRKQKGGQRHG